MRSSTRNVGHERPRMPTIAILDGFQHIVADNDFALCIDDAFAAHTTWHRLNQVKQITIAASCRVQRDGIQAEGTFQDLDRCRPTRINLDYPNVISVHDEIDAEQATDLEFA